MTLDDLLKHWVMVCVVLPCFLASACVLVSALTSAH